MGSIMQKFSHNNIPTILMSALVLIYLAKRSILGYICLDVCCVPLTELLVHRSDSKHHTNLPVFTKMYAKQGNLSFTVTIGPYQIKIMLPFDTVKRNNQ